MSMIMRSFWRAATLVVALCLPVGCAGTKNAEPAVPAAPVRTNLRVWVEPDKGVNPADVLVGCQMWRGSGVACALVQKKDEANVRVHINQEKCDPDKDGYRTLGWMAISDGDLSLRSTCFLDDKGVQQSWKVQGVAGHEFGHAVGVGWHVPKRGEGAVVCTFTKAGPDEGFEQVRAAKGVVICGDALMNRFYSGRRVVTDADTLAFEVRDETPVSGNAASDAKAGKAERKICAIREFVGIPEKK